MKNITIRLKPGDDVKVKILNISKSEKISAGIIVCSVGSLSIARFRLPVPHGSQQVIRTISEEMEILSIDGRISQNGEHCHLHICVCDKDGNAFGGHMVDGCKVRTTVELVILDLEDRVFTTEHDRDTGYDELVITNKH